MRLNYQVAQFDRGETVSDLLEMNGCPLPTGVLWRRRCARSPVFSAGSTISAESSPDRLTGVFDEMEPAGAGSGMGDGCLIVFAVNVIDGYPLVVAANRDEFYARETRTIHRWPDLPIIGGRIRRPAAPGWGECRGAGRFAAVTNVRDGDPVPEPDKRSRGRIARRLPDVRYFPGR